MKNIILPIIEYLLSLTDVKGLPLYLTPRKTFLIGFAIAVKSVFAMAEDLFNSNCNYKYLLTYKCSQDHLEILFSKIRQRLGNNNNPNVVELKTSLRKMLLKNAISSSYAANCMAFDNTSESIFEIRWRKKSKDLLNTDSSEESLSNISLFQSFEGQDFDVVKDNILYYICGFIVKNLIKKIDCSTCTDNLLENNFNEHNYNHKYKYSMLIDVKNRGGLIKCSEAVIKIVRQDKKCYNAKNAVC
ncbi:uncharacterized protein LOC126553424 [Aphis gossypii]|uniref:uncharacterized protein LOC126553424 n=1 Tax=Aphis gossypii TaxID=80765 RepID=UPI0021595200|nr:uncharacterized protein LOC126553424 [Aphis gossypii]